MRDNELLKSVKHNVEFAKMCLEGVAEGIDNLASKKSITFEDFAVNGGQILIAGIGYFISGNAAIEDVKQLAENVSIEIEQDRRLIINKNKSSFDINSFIFGGLKYRSLKLVKPPVKTC